MAAPPWDELLDADGHPRPHAESLMRFLDGFSFEEIKERQAAVDADILTLGITFTVYADGNNTAGRGPSTSCHGSSMHRSGARSSAGWCSG